MKEIDAWRLVAAKATLDKWWLSSGLADIRGYKRGAIANKAFGLIWHDRYLCDTGRAHTHGG